MCCCTHIISMSHTNKCRNKQNEKKKNSNIGKTARKEKKKKL